jgi:hypothetical protein
MACDTIRVATFITLRLSFNRLSSFSLQSIELRMRVRCENYMYFNLRVVIEEAY